MAAFPEITFTGVKAVSADELFLSAVSDELSEQDVDHAVVLRWHGGTWSYRPLEVAVRGLYAGRGVPGLLAMGVDGTIVQLTFPGERRESVDDSGDGPSELVHLRAMREIGGRLYVAGMARRVYRREAPGRWAAVDAGVFVPREQRTHAVGFHGIDGFSEDEIYAVGHKGEIWSRINGEWLREESPTNVTLTDVRCGDDGRVYITGLAGILVTGRHNAWQVVEHDETIEAFWGVARFRNETFVANYDGVFKLADGALTKVDMGIAASTAYLDATEQVLCSVGRKHVALSEDGVHWTLIDRSLDAATEIG